MGKHKTSMLQDVEAGRAIEIDALVGSVVGWVSSPGADAHHFRDLPGMLANCWPTWVKPKGGDQGAFALPQV